MRYLPIFFVLILIISLVPSPITAQDDAGLVVDAGEIIGPISPYVYGSNFGPLHVVPVDLIEHARNSGVTMLRFPGGRWGDVNDIREQQIDAFMRTCELVGAEPLIHVRLENGTPEAAAELVRYTNIEKEYGVKYWSIGNEPSLFHDYTTDDLNEQWRAIAEAMLEVDPDILLVGPDIHGAYSGNPATDPRDSEGREWVEEFLRANGDLIDIVAVHRYPFPPNMGDHATIDEMRENASTWHRIPARLRETIMETTGRDDIPIAITEANSYWSSSIGGETTPDSLFNAIWWADVLGRLIKDQVFIVGYFDFQSSDRGGFGLLERYDVRPSYYTYQLYKQFGTELVASESSVEYLSIYAALRADGALTLMVVNLADEAQTAPLAINNFEITAPAEVWRLDAENMAAQLDDVDLSDGEISVPGQSVTLYVVK